MIDLEELERIVKAGDQYGHNTPGVMLELIAEVRRLRAYQESARKQVYELMGVVVDIEQFGSGFDDACMNTVKRVMAVLAAKEKA